MVGRVVADRATALERESLVIRGVRSELTLEAGVITIRKEATTQAHPTEVKVAVPTVRGATVEAPKRGGRGWLHIASTNGSPAPVGELAASGDPFTMPIKGGNVGAARKLAKMIDKHVRERGLPGDVGPNQGRFTSGVVVSPGVKAVVNAPMVTSPAPVDVPVAPSPARTPVATEAPSKKATAKKATPKKVAVKKAVATKAPAKKATAKKATATSVTDKASLASELVGQLRELGELHKAGVLDAAEFAAAKAKILG